jgi:PAS domain S-box-containing protein
LGYKPGERGDASVYNYIHPEDRANVKSVFESLSRTPGVTYTVELRALHKTGIWKNVEVAITNMLDHPVVKGWIVNFWDVTEIKRAGEIIEKKERYYRALIENAYDVVYVMDGEGKRFYESPSTERVLGYRPGERAGESAFSNIHPEDQDAAKKTFQLALTRPGVPLQVEVRTRHKDGRWISMDVVATNLLDTEAVGGVVVNCRDITEQKKIKEVLMQQERYYRALIENSYDVVTVLDGNGMFLYESPSTERTLGFLPMERAAQSAFETIHPDDLGGAQKAFQKALENPGVPVHLEIRVRHKNGHWVHAEIEATNLLQVPAVRGIVLNSRNITERKKAEEALQQKERYFRTLIEKSYEAVGILEGNGLVRYMSPSMVNIFGYTPEERAGKSAFELIHPDDMNRAQEVFKKFVQKPGHTQTEQFRLQHKDGHYVTVDVRGSNLLEDPAVAGIVINYRDITEREKTEQALRVSEERFRWFTDVTEEGIMVHEKGIIVDLNPTLARMMGYEVSEMIGRHVSFILDSASAEKVKGYLEKGYPEGSFELRVVRKDGTSLPLMIHGRDFEYKGRKVRVSSGWDITDRIKAEEDLKKSEASFRSLIEKSPDAMIVHTLEKTIYVNEAMLRLLAYDRAEELIGLSPLVIVHPDDQTSVVARIKQLKPSEGYNPPAERRFIRKNGSLISVEVISFSILFEGQPVSVAVARDLTERQKAEQALLKYERLGAIGEMAAGMAHEIRNPLSGIDLSAQYLKKKHGDHPEALIQIQNILEQTERLKQLVNDTLDYSKDKATEDKRVLDVMELLRTSLRLAQVQYGPGNARFQVQWEVEPGRFFLLANPYRLQQVLVNLILNAFQAMGSEGKLILGCVKKDQTLTLKIEDNGPGISEENLARLFEPFFTTKNSGSGLGLSVSQRIVEAHGGKIKVERLKPRGTAFILEIPAESGGKP